MLKIQFRGGRDPAIVLEAPGKTIGKGAVNDIVIDEDGVGSFHADIKVSGDQVTITDVDTETGTRVNGKPITAETVLSAGDVVSIGRVELEVIAEPEPEAASKTLVLSGNAAKQMDHGIGWALIADSGPEKGQVIPIIDRTEIGRALSCDISILEPALSRQHAELLPHGNKLLLRDLDSANGSFVNGEKVTDAMLKDQDELQFGKVRFIVRAP
ncbi:MAG TPA: FHA domain-containing protein [Pseudomonadales bacterium]|nr:FHA domain-containing protein [Pseudomonadales bacterium]